MRSINSFLIVLLISSQLICFAGQSTIRTVTVYRQGAKISRTAKISLKPGNQEVILDDLTSSIDANSLQVVVRGNATLLSASVRKNYVGYKTLPKRLRELKDSLELLGDRIQWIENEQAIYKGEEKLILDNQKIVNEKEKITAADITQLADFYRNRLFTIRKKLYDNSIELRKVAERKQRIEKQLQELNYNRGQQMGEVVLNISANVASQVTIEFSYLSMSAGWSPIYDIRCKDTDSPLDLVYKANVYQKTGYDWSGVDLTISTGNPSANNERPVMNPWYIDFYQPPVPAMSQYQKAARAMPATPESNMLMLADESAYEMEEAAPVPFMVTQVTNQITSEYSIEVKQDIPSDGKEHIVPIRNIELPAAYSYHSVPKLDQHAFLIARVGSYGQYDLMPGTTNIFFEGMYVGQTYLNPEVVGDSLVLSMGRDDRISVKRDVLKDLTSVKTIGSSKKVAKAYEITVRNNKKTPVNLEVLDQLPIARNKDIIVEPEDINGAEYKADYGRLLWRVKLAPSETRKIRLSYSVKYPKDKQIQGL